MSPFDKLISDSLTSVVGMNGEPCDLACCIEMPLVGEEAEHGTICFSDGSSLSSNRIGALEPTGFLGEVPGEGEHYSITVFGVVVSKGTEIHHVIVAESGKRHYGVTTPPGPILHRSPIRLAKALRVDRLSSGEQRERVLSSS